MNAVRIFRISQEKNQWRKLKRTQGVSKKLFSDDNRKKNVKIKIGLSRSEIFFWEKEKDRSEGLNDNNLISEKYLYE